MDVGERFPLRRGKTREYCGIWGWRRQSEYTNQYIRRCNIIFCLTTVFKSFESAPLLFAPWHSKLLARRTLTLKSSRTPEAPAKVAASRSANSCRSNSFRRSAEPLLPLTGGRATLRRQTHKFLHLRAHYNFIFAPFDLYRKFSNFAIVPAVHGRLHCAPHLQE